MTGQASLLRCRLPGGLPEWPKGADCNSAGYAYAGSNPAPTTRTDLLTLAVSSLALGARTGVRVVAPGAVRSARGRSGHAGQRPPAQTHAGRWAVGRFGPGALRGDSVRISGLTHHTWRSRFRFADARGVGHSRWALGPVFAWLHQVFSAPLGGVGATQANDLRHRLRGAGRWAVGRFGPGALRGDSVRISGLTHHTRDACQRLDR